MAWSQSDLDAINKSIAAGVTTVRYADRSVQYRSLDEMLTIRALMTDELASPSALKNVMRGFSYSKGIT